jgi:hypothetical protein
VAGQAEFTSRQRRSLAEDGYLLMPSLLPADAVAALAARLDELARAIIAERDAAPAGSMILFNSASLWHSGTLNYSPGLRLAVTTYLSGPAAAAPGT